MKRIIFPAAVAAALGSFSPPAAHGQEATVRTHAPRPTTAAITEEDLRTRLFIFADDSMQGREAGTEGHLRSTVWLAAELQTLGLQPAGDDGTFFQAVPLASRALDEASMVSAGGTTFAMWNDVVPVRGGNVGDATSVFAGSLHDSSTWLAPDATRGRMLIFHAERGPLALPPMNEGSRFEHAAGVGIVVPAPMLQAYTNFLRPPRMALRQERAGATVPLLLLSAAAAEAMLAAPVNAAQPGRTGAPVRAHIAYAESIVPARNVIAILPGSDPLLRGQYVAIGSHTDHDGIASQPVDHDSLRAFNAEVERRQQAKGGSLTAAERREIRVNVDSLRMLRPARLDSIYNGADDDGSGSVAMLEIAEAMVHATRKPRRSMLFVWHTAEEKGLIGADWYTAHPTVPRDSIVAQLNIDMIGRGGADDIPGGGPAYLQLIGSRRLSTELGDLVERVNKQRATPFTFDYQFDATGHPEQYYCRSDHYMYARYGIPVVFFSTGDHRDYHQLTDEPQYINYGNLTRVSQLIHDVGLRLANQAARVRVDQPSPPLGAPCRQ
ncbi:MAG TPA: M28 family peptidase [Gemmatimonadaceae bacterium]|nr:M28 family peptidase [Gemmatimonadaceae bacterium]